MSTRQDIEETTLGIENVGGIDETSATISPGITVLAGRNATNRTSFLQGLMAALGSDNVSIKGDADEAHVELTNGDGTFTRTLERNGGTVTTSGDPYLEDATVADLFAFLMESNEARRAVARDADLREFIMRPVDTDDIQERIDRLLEERQGLEDEIEDIESRKADLPSLEEERTRLGNEIAEKRDELATVEEELESADGDVEETRKEKQDLQDELAELRELRAELEDVRYDVETERETLEHLRDERAELESSAAELPDAPAGKIDELDAQIEQLRSRKRTIEPQANELQNIISFNEDILDADEHEITDALAAEDDDGAVTDQLVDDQDVRCWTCGTAVGTDHIQATIERLRELSQQKLADVRDIDSELDELTDRRKQLEEQQRERDRVERRRSQVDDEIADSEGAVERLQERRKALTAEIEDVEATVEDLEDESYGAVLELHREANQLEYDIGKLEGELERVESEIADVEDRLDELDVVEEECSRVQDEIEDLRTRIDRIEQEAVEAFNEHMDTVLELLDYDNLERVWLERVEQEVREGRRKVTKNAFHLHVVRSTASGTTYEDTIAHLSESEREVTGLVFALAGYLAHDVAETVPFMVLDSLEAIDSERIATLVDYLSDHTTYLLVALLPEDASALDQDHDQITPA